MSGQKKYKETEFKTSTNFEVKSGKYKETVVSKNIILMEKLKKKSFIKRDKKYSLQSFTMKTEIRKRNLIRISLGF